MTSHHVGGSAADLRPSPALRDFASRLREQFYGLHVTDTPTEETPMAHRNPYRDTPSDHIHGYAMVSEPLPEPEPRRGLDIEDIDRLMRGRYEFGERHGFQRGHEEAAARYVSVYDEGHDAGRLDRLQQLIAPEGIAERLHAIEEVARAISSSTPAILDDIPGVRADALRVIAHTLTEILAELHQDRPNRHGRPGPQPHSEKSIARRLGMEGDETGDTPAERITARLDWLRKWLPEPHPDTTPVVTVTPKVTVHVPEGTDAEEVKALVREELGRAFDTVAGVPTHGRMPSCLPGCQRVDANPRAPFVHDPDCNHHPDAAR